MSFSYSTDEMPLELNPYLYQFTYGKVGFVTRCFAFKIAELINIVKWVLNVQA